MYWIALYHFRPAHVARTVASIQPEHCLTARDL